MAKFVFISLSSMASILKLFRKRNYNSRNAVVLVFHSYKTHYPCNFGTLLLIVSAIGNLRQFAYNDRKMWFVPLLPACESRTSRTDKYMHLSEYVSHSYLMILSTILLVELFPIQWSDNTLIHSPHNMC